MYLLDTNICIACLKGNRTVIQKITEHPTSCAIPIIVVSELFKGAHCSQKVEHNLDTVKGFLSPFPSANFDFPAAQEFGLIQAELRKIGRPTGAMDALIGAIARSQNAVLVTHNTKDFINIPALKLEDWLI